MSMSVDSLNSIQNSIFSSDTVFYAIAGTVLIVFSGIWGFRLILSLMNDSGDCSSSRPIKGSAEYYRERHAFRHSKPDSYSKFVRNNR